MASLPKSIRSLERATASEISASSRHFELHKSNLDLVEFINSRMKHPVRPVNQNAVSAFSELNESLRQRSGLAACGSWFPLVALSRDLTTTNSAAVTAPGVSKSVGNGLLPSSAVFGGGATVLSGLSGSIFALPYVDASFDASGAWHEPGESASTFSPSFQNADLVPKSISVEIIISRHLLRDSTADLDALLRSELSNRLGAAIDQAAINGDGDTQPLGLLNRPDLDVLELGSNGLALAYTHLTDIEYRASARAGVSMSAPAWVTSPKLVKKMRNTARNTSASIFEGAEILGYPVRPSISVPDTLSKGTSAGVCSAMIFGDLAEIFIGFWGPAAVDLLVDSYTLAHQQKVRLVARCEVGIAARRIGAFCAVKDALTG
ncbi:phage major capsid protein [Acidovorax sp.]|uniref:phage major capsid protein n=1 Tax=Acidovorax sp. TaxID=1872122 RepID=UPI001ACFB46B|nr:phage major capsid protein [Acidovorax sp.]MBN9627171.1 phage major capsid protein [Acidovorax sp.]